MARRPRAYDCEDCGRATVRSRWGGHPLICEECSIQRAVAAATSMGLKTGEWYDKWEKSAGPRGRPPRKSKE